MRFCDMDSASLLFGAHHADVAHANCLAFQEDTCFGDCMVADYAVLTLSPLLGQQRLPPKLNS